MSPALEALAAQHRVALADAERRIEAFKRTLERTQQRARFLLGLTLAMFLIALASLAFSIGVLTQWLV